MKPIVTIKEFDDGWSYGFWNSNETGTMDLGRSSREEAEENAQQLAGGQGLIYLPPEGHFITIQCTVNRDDGDRHHIIRQGHGGIEELECLNV